MGQAAVKSLGKEREEGAVLCFAAAPCIVIVIVAWHGFFIVWDLEVPDKYISHNKLGPVRELPRS